ncbi:lamin tail domain-containing protein [candidate division WOR-3 bacterium]|nr:lamin tail domain-containing protein [candidate division WOR-3 bacterium]
MGATLLLALACASRVVITEVMANPTGKTGVHYPEDRNEFVEIYNTSDSVIDLLDWTITDEDAIDLIQAWNDSSLLDPESLRLGTTWLDPHCYAVVLDPEYTDTAALGGYEQPYHFGPGTLILTVGNTTIGDGLTTNDPVVLCSADGDTSTFGTPWDTTDSIPCDAGDGISWERIDIDGPDTVSNWTACLDTAGCTPGAANSMMSYLDLALTGLALADSTTTKPGEPLFATVNVSNSGWMPADNWSLSFFLDRNGNTLPDNEEEDTTLFGPPLLHGQDTTLQASLTCPSATSDLCARLLSPDADTTNDFLRLTVLPGGAQRLFDLNLSSFSPDGDGFEDSLAVVYRLPQADGTLKVTVFDLGGRQVTTLFSGRPSGERGTVCWNGLNSSGTRAPTGIYAVCVEYRYSGTTRAEKLPVVLLRK